MLATRERFYKLCLRIGAKDNPIIGRTVDDTYNELITTYTGTSRHYHDINHISEGLSLIDETRHLAENPDLLEMKWWWHDETYKTKDNEAKLNELRSAVNAFTVLRELSVPDQVCVAVMAGIMPTLHSYIPVDHDDKLMVDIDLVRIAAPWETFCLNAENIRKEYEATIEEFRIGQVKFFQNFIKKRKYIFLTEQFRVKYEMRARENIRKVFEFVSQE